MSCLCVFSVSSVLWYILILNTFCEPPLIVVTINILQCPFSIYQFIAFVFISFYHIRFTIIQTCLILYLHLSNSILSLSFSLDKYPCFPILFLFASLSFLLVYLWFVYYTLFCISTSLYVLLLLTTLTVVAQSFNSQELFSCTSSPVPFSFETYGFFFISVLNQPQANPLFLLFFHVIFFLHYHFSLPSLEMYLRYLKVEKYLLHLMWS